MDLHHRSLGTGRPLLLIHGAGEDAGMLTPQAEAFAARGRRVIWYDRRGTGASTRDGWPGRGVAGHADDAADLLRTLGAAPATVVGFSSGGVIAMALAARHPDAVTQVIAWEPAAVGVLPGGEDLHVQTMAPIEAHLQANPRDWTGAYLVMLGVLSDGQADLQSETVRSMVANAEPAVRDDARIITRHRFGPGDLAGGLVTVAVGAGTTPVHALIARHLQELTGRSPLVVQAASDHEVYLAAPDILADALAEQ